MIEHNIKLGSLYRSGDYPDVILVIPIGVFEYSDIFREHVKAIVLCGGWWERNKCYIDSWRLVNWEVDFELVDR